MSDTIRATILAADRPAGAAPGQPMGACDPENPRNRRRRCSLLVERDGPEGTTQVLIDTGPDLVPQLLDAGVATLDAVVYTHAHADHVHGIDDLPAGLQRAPHPAGLGRSAHGRSADDPLWLCLRNARGQPLSADLRAACDRRPDHHRRPRWPADPDPFRVQHGEITALGFRIGGLVYLPDVSTFPTPHGR